MHQKEAPKDHTGFVAYYESGMVVCEENTYFSKSSGRTKATNWSEVEKDKLVALELLWNGEIKARVDKVKYPHLTPSDWYFSHYGSLEMSTHKTQVVSRNIGYYKDSLLTLFRVEEKSGVLNVEHRSK